MFPPAGLPVSLSLAGLGVMQAVPDPSAPGTVVPGRPDGAVGVQLFLKAGDKVRFYYTSNTAVDPTAAPTVYHEVNGEREVPLFFVPSLALRILDRAGTPALAWM